MSEALYDLAALDMDGTLLNSDHVTTPFTRAALLRASEAGKVIALCTGRCLSELWAHLAVLPAVRYAICENGGCLYDAHERRTLYQAVIPPDTARDILDLAARFDVISQCFVDGQSCMALEDEGELARFGLSDFAPVFRAGSVFVDDVRAEWKRRGGDVGKVNIFFTSEGEKARFRQALGDVDLQLAGSLGTGFEISPPGISKGAGLRMLCARLGIPVERSMAVGDGGNDLELMGAAGFPVAMGNADAAVKRAAAAVTEDCDHDGAARAVLRWTLGE